MENGEEGRAPGKEAFLRVKEEVRQSWRALGMLHLRMQNDLDANSGKGVAVKDVRKKLEDVMQKLERALADCQTDGKEE